MIDYYLVGGLNVLYKSGGNGRPRAIKHRLSPHGRQGNTSRVRSEMMPPPVRAVSFRFAGAGALHGGCLVKLSCARTNAPADPFLYGVRAAELLTPALGGGELLGACGAK